MAPLAFGADWESLHALAADTRIEVVTQAGEHARASFVSASAGTLVAREKKGERSFAKTEIVEVKVYDNSRRVRQGLIWTAIGAGLGAGIGFAVCPSCSNEGHGGKYVGP